MLKNPIPQVTDPLQYRAIGIVNGKFTPHDSEQLNKGLITDNEGEKIETVVLGKALSLLKKHIDLKKNYYWVVYPKNKNTQNKEFVIKICSASKIQKLKNKNFKLVIKGELSLKLLNSFLSLDVIRDGNFLKLLNYEVIEKNLSKKLE